MSVLTVEQRVVEIQDKAMHSSYYENGGIAEDILKLVREQIATAERRSRLKALHWTLESGDDEIQAEIASLEAAGPEGCK